MDRKEFIKLPMEERRRILREQANDPEVMEYYLDMMGNHTHQCLESPVQSSKPIYHLKE